MGLTVPEVGGDDGSGVQAFDADEFIVQVVGFDHLTVDGGIKIGLQRVEAMTLCRDGIGHLPATAGGIHRRDFLVVQQDVDSLADAAHRDIGEGNQPVKGRTGVKGRADGRFDGIDVEIDGAAVFVGIRHLNPHRVAAHREIQPQISGYRPLGDVQHGLDDAVYRDLHDTVARGHLILQRGPGDLNGASLPVGDGFTQPSAGVADLQNGIVAAGAAGTAARAGEGAEGACDHHIVGSQVQVSVFHKGSIHLAGEHQFHGGVVLLHLLSGSHSQFCIPGGIEGIVLGVFRRGKGLACVAFSRPGDGFGILGSLGGIL